MKCRATREMITMAARRFPVRIRIAVPLDGLGRRHGQMTAWLDENCGSHGWVMTPSGMRGVLNDLISLYFADATLARAFVARWCIGSKADTADGVFQVREDEPAPGSGRGCIARRKARFDLLACPLHSRANLRSVARSALVVDLSLRR